MHATQYVLVTNDGGAFAPTLLALVQAMRLFGAITGAASILRAGWNTALQQEIRI